MMTIDEFFEDLLHSGAAFELDGDRIRTSGGECPLTYLCRVEMEMHFDPDEYWWAANALGLHCDDADLIAAAADDGLFGMDDYPADVRRRLMQFVKGGE